jgi:hypothetical protein
MLSPHAEASRVPRRDYRAGRALQVPLMREPGAGGVA